MTVIRRIPVLKHVFRTSICGNVRFFIDAFIVTRVVHANRVDGYNSVCLSGAPLKRPQRWRANVLTATRREGSAQFVSRGPG